VPLLRDGNYVIDSIRNPEEIRILRQAGRFLLIGVDAPIELRFQRAKARGRVENAGTVEEFRKLEERELSAHSSAQQLDLCLAQADVVVINDSSVGRLRKKIERVLSERSFP
jgi:dephospho-CoA kinase